MNTLSPCGHGPLDAEQLEADEEPEKTLGIASGGTTQCGPTPLVDSQIHLRTRASDTKGAIGRACIVLCTSQFQVSSRLIAR